jgi:hypothetical protein
MIEAAVLIPVRDNEGQSFPRSLTKELERRFRRFGGHTQSPVSGAWVGGSGRVYRDRSRQYTVSLASWTQIPDWLNVVHWLRECFQQQAVYIRIAGLPEIVGGD